MVNMLGVDVGVCFANSVVHDLLLPVRSFKVLFHINVVIDASMEISI